MKFRLIVLISIYIILLSGIRGQAQQGIPARGGQVTNGNRRANGPGRGQVGQVPNGGQLANDPLRGGQVQSGNLRLNGAARGGQLPNRNIGSNAPIRGGQGQNANLADSGPARGGGQVPNSNGPARGAQAQNANLQANVPARNGQVPNNNPTANGPVAQVPNNNPVNTAQGGQIPNNNNNNVQIPTNNGQGISGPIRGPPPSAPTDNTLVQLPNGPARGKEWGMYYSWESIPYAEPPVGDLRFEDPQPYNRRWNGEFNATLFPQHCLQWYRDRGVNRRRGQEDCLTVNVYSPKPRGNSYPVVAYIHGGHFMLGGGPVDDPEQSMIGSRLIMVKINYRVGPLGFLSTGDSNIPGNYGLKDQRLALQWIRQNIAAFGGDPEKIMVLGHGSGGASTHLHMLQPSLASIAKVAVSMSGVALNPWAITPNARDNALRLAAAVNCTNVRDTRELKTCLKSRMAYDVVDGVQNLLNFGYNPFVTFGPVIEPANTPNAFLTQPPEDIIRSGRFSQIPWLVSYAAEDGAFNAAELLRINSRTGLEFLNELNTNWLDVAPQNLFLSNMRSDAREYAQSLKTAYLGNDNFTVQNYAKVQKMYTDILVRLGVLKAMQLHSRYSQAPVYGYIYDVPANHGIGYDMSLRRDIKFGASHMDDITLLLRPPSRSTLRPDEVVVSQRLVNMLANFADSNRLSFGECNFESNTAVDSNNLKLLRITSDRCETVVQDVSD